MRQRIAALALFLFILVLQSACAGSPAHRLAIPTAIDAVSSPEWAVDMQRFAAQDAVMPPPRHPIVFTGSSSIRLWDTLAGDFPNVPVLNRGFGGSQLRDAFQHADAIAIRYQPRQVVLYAGDNELSAGRTPQQILADFRAVVARFRHDLPNTTIIFISPKPSPSRAHLLGAQRVANALIHKEAARMGRVAYADVFTPMLDASGQPRVELFAADGLHVNRASYVLWQTTIAPFLLP
ncbi:MAG: GDSL-type esterase/lipase family protein [Lysobacter sp.]|nr:GDSL-type esterase/lipase family protein [Lysobacter sp.]